MDNITKALISELKLDMIDEGLWKDIAAEIGVENLCKVLYYIGGIQVYAPKLERIIKPVRDERIRKEFDGANYAGLAKKYNLAERTVREIVANGQILGQVSIAEFL